MRILNLWGLEMEGQAVPRKTCFAKVTLLVRASLRYRLERTRTGRKQAYFGLKEQIWEPGDTKDIF